MDSESFAAGGCLRAPTEPDPGKAALVLRGSRRYVGGDIQHVVLAEGRYDGLHEAGPQAFSGTLLHIVHLPHHVAG